MERVFMNAAGLIYKAEKAARSEDAEKPSVSDNLLRVLTATPITEADIAIKLKALAVEDSKEPQKPVLPVESEGKAKQSYAPTQPFTPPDMPAKIEQQKHELPKAASKPETLKK